MSDSSAVVMCATEPRSGSEVLIDVCPLHVIQEQQIHCPHPILVSVISGRCLCLPSMPGLLASISNLPARFTALSNPVFHTSSAFSCCRWAIVAAASLAEVVLFLL